MCQSRGILSPIQHAAAAPRRWSQHHSTPEQVLSVKGRRMTPGSSSSRHPSKRAASARDIWEDTLPTPEKYKPVQEKGSSKMRTPFQTIGTPNTLSTCSSRTSLSSTSSFLTPDLTRAAHWTAVTPTTPAQDRDGFKVPVDTARTKSRQRLRRL